MIKGRHFVRTREGERFVPADGLDRRVEPSASGRQATAAAVRQYPPRQSDWSSDRHDSNTGLAGEWIAWSIASRPAIWRSHAWRRRAIDRPFGATAYPKANSAARPRSSEGPAADRTLVWWPRASHQPASAGPRLWCRTGGRQLRPNRKPIRGVPSPAVGPRSTNRCHCGHSSRPSRTSSSRSITGRSAQDCQSDSGVGAQASC
jgi:hypothetical protein